MGSMRKCRLSHYRQERPTGGFVSGSTATNAASLRVVSHKAATLTFSRLRGSSSMSGRLNVGPCSGSEVEVDESCFVGGARAGAVVALRGRIRSLAC